MIVRISNRGNRHYGYYGIVYKESEIKGRKQILFLLDNEGNQCITTGWSERDSDLEIIPDEENRDTFGWPPPLCDSKIMNVASDLSRLVKDGRKYRGIKELLKDER
jgi:hypothetical protein